MKHRIFIAINLPQDIQKELANYHEKWPDLPVKWTRNQNLHVTLAFLGYVEDEEIPEICNKVGEIARRHKPFSISLKKIYYGPPEKIPPRMVWVSGKCDELVKEEKTDRLSLFQKEIEGAFFSVPSFKGQGKRCFVAHITLGRVKTWEWRKIEPEERPEVDQEIDLSFEVSSVEVMESNLKRGGPQYAALESYPLGEKL